jgi:hypothetical protein
VIILKVFAVISFCIALAVSAPREQKKKTGYPYSYQNTRNEDIRTENQLQGTVGFTVPLGTEKEFRSYLMSTPPYHDLESQLQSPQILK